MTFVSIFFCILTIIFGLSGFIIYPVLALESYDCKSNFFPIAIAVMLAAFFAYGYITSDGIEYKMDEETGILTVNVYDSEKKVNEVRINHVITEREWKFF